MNIGTTFEAHAQASESMQPCDRSLHDPAGGTQAAAVPGIASGDFGIDAQIVQLLPMRVRIVGAVSLYDIRPPTWMAWFARNRRNRLDQWHQLGDIVGVGAREYQGKRDALRVDREVVLGTRMRAIGGVRSCF